ncbi:MAG: hypothetical protein C0502_07675 [Opitutus sp.]|nr:hypothetical protein [Opitutus sp.]
MKPSERLVSLDASRGATIAAMLLVNNPGPWSARPDAESRVPAARLTVGACSGVRLTSARIGAPSTSGFPFSAAGVQSRIRRQPKFVA